MDNLSTLPIGQKTDIGGLAIKPVLTVYGCLGCAFQTEQGAAVCPHKEGCFGHHRTDRESVIFSRIV